jgi:dTDP-4-dehydrorhamnose 3,5-epimerase
VIAGREVPVRCTPVMFRELGLPGVFAIETEPYLDERGSFARTFCVEELAANGLEAGVAQCSVSANPHRGTLRGLHLQLAPHEETKLVRCSRGAIFDVVVDLRGSSPTLGGWLGVELSAASGGSIYLPRGMAHGFLVLEDDTQVEYLTSAQYAPGHAVGIRWDDPAIGIDWPFAPCIVSERDRGFADVDLDALRTRGLESLR